MESGAEGTVPKVCNFKLNIFKAVFCAHCKTGSSVQFGIQKAFRIISCSRTPMIYIYTYIYIYLTNDRYACSEGDCAFEKPITDPFVISVIF